MKYMLMTFGDAADMMAAQSPEWIRDMIAFMIAIDKDLQASDELVFQQGLADGSTAKLVSLKEGLPIITDGAFPGSQPSLTGYWVVEVASEARAIEIASQIAAYAGVVEVRECQDAPPEM